MRTITRPGFFQPQLLALAVALGVAAFKWIVNRMPVLGEHPSYRGSEY